MISCQTKILYKTHINRFGYNQPVIEAKPINKTYVHKKLDKNIAITYPVLLSEEGPIHRTRIVVANENDFYFDHDLRHLPGMLLVEAARQFAIALSHIHFNIPLSDRFLLKDISCLFCELGNKRDPVYMDLIILRYQIRERTIRFMRALCYIHQNGTLLAATEGLWCTVTKKIFDKLEDDMVRTRSPGGVMAETTPYMASLEKPGTASSYPAM